MHDPYSHINEKRHLSYWICEDPMLSRRLAPPILQRELRVVLQRLPHDIDTVIQIMLHLHKQTHRQTEREARQKDKDLYIETHT